MIAYLTQNVGQKRPAAGPHFDQREARIRAGLADRDPFDPKSSARRGNQIKDLRQHETIDDMPRDLDVFNEFRGRGALRGRGHGHSGFFHVRVGQPLIVGHRMPPCIVG